MIPFWYREIDMASLLIKDLPRNVHNWLKREASKNRRSMTQQAIVILQERMKLIHPVRFPEPQKTRTPLTMEFIDRAKREGRP